MRTGVATALDLPDFAAARTGLTEADETEVDLTESEPAAVEADATDGTVSESTASADMILFTKNPFQSRLVKNLFTMYSWFGSNVNSREFLIANASRIEHAR